MTCWPRTLQMMGIMTSNVRDFGDVEMVVNVCAK